MDFNNQQIAAQDLPRFDEVSFTSLAHRYATIRLIVTIICFVLLGSAGIGSVIVAELIKPDPPSLWENDFVAVTATLFLLLMSFCSWFAFAATRAIGYAIRDHDIIVRSGLLWKKEVIQPLKRVQHVEVTRGPIDKRYGLANVQLFSAGTSMSTFRIPGIEDALAEKIRQYVLHYQEVTTTTEPQQLG